MKRKKKEKGSQRNRPVGGMQSEETETHLKTKTRGCFFFLMEEERGNKMENDEK